MAANDSVTWWYLLLPLSPAAPLHLAHATTLRTPVAPGPGGAPRAHRRHSLGRGSPHPPRPSPHVAAGRSAPPPPRHVSARAARRALSAAPLASPGHGAAPRRARGAGARRRPGGGPCARRYAPRTGSGPPRLLRPRPRAHAPARPRARAPRGAVSNLCASRAPRFHQERGRSWRAGRRRARSWRWRCRRRSCRRTRSAGARLGPPPVRRSIE